MFLMQYNPRDILPLRRVPFMGLEGGSPVPSSVSSVLAVQYGENATRICKTNYLDHK